MTKFDDLTTTAKDGLKTIAKKLEELTDTELEKITGGTGEEKTSYQLYYMGVALPMNNTLAQLCSTYPQIKDIFGIYYAIFSSYTLNQLCALATQEVAQGLIDEYEKSLKNSNTLLK